MSKNHHTYLSTRKRKCLICVNLWNWEVLLTKIFVRLPATLYTVQSMLVHKNASNCSKMAKKIIRQFYDIIKRVLYLSYIFSENSLRSNILNHLQTKVTPTNPHSCISFFQYDPKVVRILINLIFLVLGWQMIKNYLFNYYLMQPATIYFCIFVQPLWISFLFWNV